MHPTQYQAQWNGSNNWEIVMAMRQQNNGALGPWMESTEEKYGKSIKTNWPLFPLEALGKRLIMQPYGVYRPTRARISCLLILP